MSDKIKPKNPLLEDLENKEIVPTGTTDKLIFRGNNPFNVWRGSQYLTPQYTPGRDYIAYSNGENIWRVPLEKIYPVNDDDLTPQQRLERDWRKSPAYGIDKVILGTLAGTMAPFAIAEAAPALAGLAAGASDAAMATRAGQAIYQGLTSPVGKAALSFVFGGMGMHNFFSDNGYKKTLQEWENLLNDPSYYNTVNFGKSALGDAMDVTMMAPLYKPLTYMGKEAWNAGRQGVEGAWNWAAQHGNDYARARQLSKLFNSGIEKTTLRSNPRYISQNGVNYSLYDSFGEPIGNAMIGDLNGNGRNMVHSIRSARKNAHKVSEDIYNTAIDNITSSGGEGLESGWDLLSPHKTLPVTEKFPHLVIGESQGHDVRLLTGTTERPLPQYIEGNHYLDITPKTKIQFNKETGKFENVPVQTAVEESPTLSWEEASRPYLDWSPNNWFKNISGRTSYSAEEAEELASFVPEYRQIEKRLWDEGKLTTDINGNVIVKDSKMSPQEYIMRQSENFQKKMNPEHHYVGVKKDLRDNFENGSRDPYGEGESYEVWTDRKSPKNVEEYAYSGFGGKTIDDEIKSIEELYKGTEQYYESKVKDLQQEKEWLGDLMSDAEYNRKLDEIKMLRENDLSGYRKGLEALTKKRETDPLNGGKIYDVTYPKETAEPPIIDAEGSHWSMIPFENARRDAPELVSQYLRHAEWPEHISTNSLVRASELQDYGVTHINNVMDTGNGTLLNETIIGKDTPVKSVLGNTGAFSLEGPNRWKLYRSFLPWLTGAGTAGTLYGISQDNTHAYGGPLNTYKSWNDLSVKEKSEMMKVAIRNGVTNLADIKAKYNEFAEGGNLYSKGDKLKKKKSFAISPNAQYAMRYFMNRGLAPHQAAGLVGNLMRESGASLDIKARNPSGGAFGLAQWLGARQKNLFARYGRTPSLQQQLDYIWHELNTTHKKGLQTLMASKDATEAAKNAFGWYEFYVGPEGAVAEMNKHRQNGMASLNKGITNAALLMGQPIPENIQLNIPQKNTFAMQPQMYQMQQPQMAYNPFEGWQFQNESILNGSYNPERDNIIMDQAQQLAQLQTAYDKQEKERLLAAQQQAKAEERALQRDRTNLALQMVGMMGGDDSDNSYFDMWKSFV